MRKHYSFQLAFCLLVIVATSCRKQPTIEDVKLCNNPNGNVCAEDQNDFFGVETDTVHLFAVLKNAPEKVKVDVTWFYKATDMEKEEILRGTFDGDESSSIHAKLYLNEPGWPTGDYSVVIQLAGEDSEPVEKKFKIE